MLSWFSFNAIAPPVFKDQWMYCLGKKSGNLPKSPLFHAVDSSACFPFKVNQREIVLRNRFLTRYNLNSSVINNPNDNQK